MYTENKYKVINEWELPIYDETFQERGYHENSAVYHVHANSLHRDYKYVGFFQYDMVFNDNIIDVLHNNIQVPTSFYYSSHDFSFCSFETWNECNTLRYVIHDYEKFYKPFDTSLEYPLYNSYVIPIENYETIMKWVIQLYNKLYPWCIEPPNKSHFGHIAGIYERIMAYAIGGENLRSVKLNVSHEINLKKQCY